VYGWNLLVVSDARTKLPWAAQGVPIQAPETLLLRALVTPARTNGAGAARLHKVVCAKGFGDGTDVGWLDQRGIPVVVPANAKMAGTAEAQAHAAAGAGLTVGRRTQTVRHGHGTTAWPERLATAVVGLTSLTTADQDGTPEQARHAHRRAVQANPLNAVVVRQGPSTDYGPGGKTVVLTNAAGQRPVPPFADADDRRRMEHGCLKEAKQPWDLGHPPQQTARAVRVPGVFTLLLCALATASRLERAREARGGAPVGWQRWRRQLREQTREQVIGFAQGSYGMFHLAEYSLLVGGKRKDRPPGVGSHQAIWAQYGLRSRR
jgi:hypothetical protein